MAFDPLILLLLAMVLEGAAGFAIRVFKLFPSLLDVVKGLIRFFDRKLNRAHRSQMDRAIRGVLITVLIMALCMGLSAGILWIAGHIQYGWALELLLTASLLTQGQTYVQARRLAKHISASEIDDARTHLAMATSHDTANLDEHALCRTAIEYVTENFVTGVVAPVFWFVLFGFPGLLVTRAVHVMAVHLEQPGEQYRAFGLTACRLNDSLNFIPARLASLFIAAAAAFTPTARPGQAMSTMGRDAGRYPSVNLGWPLAAMAGALSLTLAGPRPGRPDHDATPWIGEGSARTTAQDVNRAVYVYSVACLFNLAGIAGLAVLRYGLP